MVPCFLLVYMYFIENNLEQKCRDKEREIRRQGRIIDEYRRRLVQDVEDTAAMSGGGEQGWRQRVE